MNIGKFQLKLRRVTFKRLFLVVLSSFFVGTILCAFGYLGWYYFIQVQPKVLSGINWYRHPITISVNGEECQLDILDTYSFEVISDSSVTLRAYDADGVMLEKRQHYIGKEITYVVDLWSDQSESQLCFVEADVTPLHYSATGETVSLITDVTVINAEPSNSAKVTKPYPPEHYMYMNNYSTQALPDSIESSTHILGLSPVSCQSLEDSTNLQEEIVQWSLYSPEIQRELYQTRLSEIL